MFLKAVEFFDTNAEIMDEFLEETTTSLREYIAKYANREELVEVLRTKLEGSFTKEEIYDEETGEVLIEAETVIDEEIINRFLTLDIDELTYWEVKPEDKVLANSLVHDSTKNSDEAVLEVFKKLQLHSSIISNFIDI